MSLFDGLVEIAAQELHRHGDLWTASGPQPPTRRWRDCPRSDAHGGAARSVVEAVIDHLHDERIEWRYQADADLDEVERLVDALRESP